MMVSASASEAAIGLSHAHHMFRGVLVKSQAVAQKVGVVETAAEFFQERATRAKPGDLERIMRKVPDVQVEPEDAIPPDLAERLSRLP